MDILIPENIIKGTFSVKKKNSKYEKAHLKLIEINGVNKYQISLYTETQVFHNNYDVDNINLVIIDLLETYFNNLELFTPTNVYGYRISSKGKLLTNKRNNNTDFVITAQNKEKNRLLKEGVVIPALVDLGIMNNEGKVLKAGYDKYRQINRFIEIINDSIKDEKYLKIIDFGCGKSYLTFILYHYLVNVKKISCDIIGLDLKSDVIDNCNKLASKYKYDHLKFLKGNIQDFKDEKVDMIVTLHACDTATDYALYHAINMKCRYIFSVPCCQHEINNELDSRSFHLITKYGILKERFSSLLTDSIRANILEYYGYKTQVMEFVDFDNSPKNLLIRAQLTNNKNTKIKEELGALLNEYHINQKLYDLLFK